MESLPLLVLIQSSLITAGRFYSYAILLASMSGANVRFYGDESGMHGSGSCVVAGYLATAENWEHFDTDWRVALQEDRACPFFKRGESYSGPELPFVNWTYEPFHQKVNRMIEVFRRFAVSIIEVSSSMQWADYKYLSDLGVERIAGSNPYLPCFKGVIALAIEETKKVTNLSSDEPAVIDFFFDDTEAMRGIAKSAYDQVYEQFPQLRRFIGKECHFRDDKTVPGLQAADLIAWHIHKSLEPSAPKSADELRRLRSMYRATPKSNVWSRKGLEEWLRRHPAPQPSEDA